MRDDLQDPYYRPRNSNAFTTMALLVIGISIGMVLIVTLKKCDREPDPVTAQINCAGCHKPPVITGYRQYKRFHQRPNADDKRLAEELKAQKQLLTEMQGVPR